MTRKKRPPEQENHDRWLISYADFITLLFAFFVVMYSISSVNEGKYRVLSDSMVAAFRAPEKSLAPIQVGDTIRAIHRPMDELRKSPRPLVVEMIRDQVQGDGSTADDSRILEKAREQIRQVVDEAENSLSDLIEDDLITVRHSEYFVEIDVKSSVLFASGSSALALNAKTILQRLADLLGRFPNQIQVEGFTDSLPISTAVYPSNWELSAGRAATVVRLFEGYGVNPVGMASIGYGEFRPIASNDTPVGRSKNRRVSIVVKALLDSNIHDALREFEQSRQSETTRKAGASINMPVNPDNPGGA